MEYIVGFCQYKPQLKDIDGNLGRIGQLLHGVKADLIVFPELAVSGYVFENKEELEAIAEDPYEGKTVQFFRDLAKKKNVSCIVGFPEKKTTDNNSRTLIYNSSFLANPDGSYYVYRKMHLFNREKLIFTPGNGELLVYSAKNGVKVGMMICFDWIFPESARTLALRGAQIICHPANLVLPWCQQAMITRSVENRLFTITSNRVGKEENGSTTMTFTGQSQVTSPKGEVLYRYNEAEEGIWTTAINPADADNKMVTEFNHILNDRRPEKYED